MKGEKQGTTKRRESKNKPIEGNRGIEKGFRYEHECKKRESGQERVGGGGARRIVGRVGQGREDARKEQDHRSERKGGVQPEPSEPADGSGKNSRKSGEGDASTTVFESGKNEKHREKGNEGDNSPGSQTECVWGNLCRAKYFPVKRVGCEGRVEATEIEIQKRVAQGCRKGMKSPSKRSNNKKNGRNETKSKQ